MASTSKQRQMGPFDAPVGHYSSGAIMLHWMTVVLVCIAAALGFLRDSWPSRQEQTFWIDIHAIVGLAIWTACVVRLWCWARRLESASGNHRQPDHLRPIATFVHVLLYALLLVTPIIGFITFIYHGRIFDFGLFRIDPGIQQNRAIYHPTQNIHGYLAYALLTIASFHAIAGLWHHFYLRDGLLWRMWPLQGYRR